MSGPLKEFEVNGRTYRVRFERRIIRSQRSIMATAYDDNGQPAAREEMNTASARSFLGRDAESEPPTWDELESLVVDMLKLQLEE